MKKSGLFLNNMLGDEILVVNYFPFGQLINSHLFFKILKLCQVIEKIIYADENPPEYLFRIHRCLPR